MKTVPFLLGCQRRLRNIGSDGKQGPSDLDEDDWELQYDLKRPDQVVIADDTNGFQLFGDAIFTAPQEDLLECQRLSDFMCTVL